MTGADALLPSLDLVFRVLARASVEGGLFVVVIWAVTRAIPRLPAGARATLWWIACARFVVSLAGIAPLGLPLSLPAPLAAALPGPAPVASPLHAAQAASRFKIARLAPPADPRQIPFRPAADGRDHAETIPAPTAHVSTASAWPWTAWLAAAWLCLLVLALARIVFGIRRSALVVRGATRIDPAALPTMRRMAQRFGLPGDPDVRVSGSVRSPQLIWAGHGIVLFPTAALGTWTSSDVELALAHEFAHLRRHDLAWGLAATVVGRAFAFHPLARLAAREYALAREAACDAEVLARTDASPFDYGRLLVALGVTRRPALSLSSAAWSGRSLKRRLVMLEHHSSSGRFHPRWIVIPAALFAGLVGLTAAAPGPAASQHTSQPAQTATDDPPPVDAVVAQATLIAGDGQAPPPPPPPRPPAAPRAPAPPPPPPPPPHAHGGLHMESMDEVADAWVYLSGDRTVQRGSRHDRRIAEGLRKGSEPIFWFARDGKEYVIRDKATLDRVEQLLAPERVLADDQGALAQSQAKLAHEQAQIAAQQAEVASRAAELGAKQAALQAEQARLHAEMMASRPDQGIHDATAREIEAKARDYDEKHRALEAEMHKHEEQLQALEPEHAHLAREMEKRAYELQAQMVQSSRELKELLTETIASGVAQAVR